jgi:Co/Zn/Cd efflux system component
MSVKCCQAEPDPQRGSLRYRRILWIVLATNGAMFLAELMIGLAAGSVSLQADALDFFGDAANYGISLFVAGMAIRHRARAALLKGISMGCLGIWILGAATLHAIEGTVPQARTMGIVGFVALVANALSFALLWSYRRGDSNMQSVWVCSRNDVLGNCAVLLAALGVFGTSRGWPDALVALTMGSLAIQGALAVTKTASRELAEAAP